MPTPSDAQLLRDYAKSGSEAAFREIVVRYTDAIYSSALRQVKSPDLAADLTQRVFTDLAREAGSLSAAMTANASVIGSLFRSTRYAALNLRRDDQGRQARERQAMELLLQNSDVPADWEQIRPVLDEALDLLADEDREALLLRFFKNHDLRTVGATLGISDDAEQKRVSRAVERLREFFAKRGVSVGASGLAVVISANAVQAAPVGLALTISTAAALTGTTLATTATVTATKAIAMTTLQKTIITATIAILAGAGIYEARYASQLRDQVQMLQQQQAPLAEQIEQVNQALMDATNRLAALHDDNERLSRSTAELLKLRGAVGMLQKESDEFSALRKALIQLQTNRLKFKGPFFNRDEFSNRGTDEPLNTVLTMLWAMREGDEIKLDQLIAPSTNSQTIESITRLRKDQWSQIVAIQVVEPSEDITLSRPGPDQETAFVKAIIERQWSPPILQGQPSTDQSLRVWNLIKTNGHWLLSDAH